MGIGVFFWIGMFAWLILGGLGWRQNGAGGPFLIGGNLLLFFLLFVLGWKSFGFPIHG